MGVIKMRTKTDCYKCCLAEIFNMDYEDVPDFFGQTINIKSTEQCVNELKEWLQKIGYIRIYANIDCINGLPIDVSGNIKAIAIVRNRTFSMYSHAVVLRFEDGGKTLCIDDPMEQENIDISEIFAIQFFLPIITYKSLSITDATKGEDGKWHK